MLISGFTPTASAEDDSAVEVVRELVPGVFSETAPITEVAVSRTADGEIKVQDIGAGEENSPVSLLLGSTDVPISSEAGFSEVETANSSLDQLIQPLSQGFRILNISRDALAPTEFEYGISVPPGASVEQVFGTIRITLGDEILGSIREPWAIDADGKAVETYFTLEGNVITQHLVTTASTSYPIVSDPNWGYIGVWNLSGSYKVAWERLHTCFNCYFPVDGAPSKWPAFGQLLPLRYGIFNMECKMNYIFTSTSYYRWKFLATKNHLDGLGSNIIFELRRTSAGQNQLVVDAWIVNDVLWPGGNSVYEIAARLNWYQFSVNLNTY